VKPSPQGTTWGLGGTCVNVGCIPKKLMHKASLLGEDLEDAKKYGWILPEEIEFSWEKMVEAVQDHIGALNWGYKVTLKDKKVDYLNALAKFIDPHTVETKTKAGKVTKFTARRFVVAVGGRPRYPSDLPGSEHCISSDDIFSMTTPPGKSLVIGASYVALECAGFLTGLGFDTTVMVRSILLRGFDQSCAEQIGAYMAEHGTKFIRPANPSKVEKLENGKLKVYWSDQSDVFDTVLIATGRKADTENLGLENAGVLYDNSDGKISVTNERTNVPHIYAIGDVIKGNLELTPVAIMTGRLLARRLFNKGKVLMNYQQIATTVFTPIEYGCVGLSEEAAISEYGDPNIEVYHSYYTPLEFTVTERGDNICYAKVIVNKLDNEKVLGIHVLGINAGEIIQGFSVALKLGVTKSQLDTTVGIHPTCAEEVLDLKVTKRSGLEAKKKGC